MKWKSSFVGGVLVKNSKNYLIVILSERFSKTILQANRPELFFVDKVQLVDTHCYGVGRFVLSWSLFSVVA